MPAVGQLLGHVRHLAAECPLTDVISVKGAVLAEVRSAGLLDRYVGGHPMAGTAHPAGARVRPGCSPVRRGSSAWTSTSTRASGPRSCTWPWTAARSWPATSDEHDAAAAAISHLPHLLAEALAATAGEVPLAFALAAGSFRDGHPGGG